MIRVSQGRAPSLITIRERGDTKMFRSVHKWPQSGRLHNRPEKPPGAGLGELRS